jgi:hypothetical protein
MNTLTEEQIKYKIRMLTIVKSEIDSTFDKMVELTGMSLDSELGQLIYTPFNMYMRTLDAISNNSQWLAWFVWDNDCGSKGLAAGINGDINPIKTVDDLFELIF